MKSITILFIVVIHLSCSQDMEKHKEYRKLTAEEERVIIYKGTEAPFTGKYYNSKEVGTYTCKQCGLELFHSYSKFNSGTGWPSFDEEIAGSIKQIPDADGKRTEIVCANCNAHLGHVFKGEGFTSKNVRHCVNSISLCFEPKQNNNQTKDTAIFASGCFWGTQYWFKKAKGVISTTVGYTGGHIKNPSYREVCAGTTGHAEAVQVIFNPQEISYQDLVKLFFETHDPTQINRQGPDIGEQYRSEIFYLTHSQKETAEQIVNILMKKGMKIATKITNFKEFYQAEEYHQDYYEKHKKIPYCHFYTKRF
ncbi:MAG: bifunctional methionine sulfoxide reductase B/A protein [Bacteroidales bacterium]